MSTSSSVPGGDSTPRATHGPVETSRSAEAGRPVESAEPSRPVGQGMYDLVGGHAFFQRLVDEFYRGVADDEPLRAMYPEADLGPAADRLRMFLEQYWGGPHTYHEQRGHPRLRMRHAPFAVTPTQRDRWLTHMRHALDEQHLEPALDAEMWAYLAGAAQFLVNAAE